MARLLTLLLLGLVWIAPLQADEAIIGVDHLFPELAHPNEDALRSIRAHDYRFITINRAMTVVPGVEDHPQTVRHHGTKFVKQPVHLFLSRSRTFSYNIRLRAYAADYNQTLLRYLLQKKQEKLDQLAERSDAR